MRWRPSKFHDKFQDVFSNFYSLRNVKFNLQGQVTRGNIIGHFGPSSLNKQFSLTSKMHNSLIPNPNDVVTQLNRDEIATTFMKEPFSFGAHSKSYSRWEKWSFDFVLRKLCLESHFLWWKIIGHFVGALVNTSISKDHNLLNFYAMRPSKFHVSRCLLQLLFFEKCQIQLARACDKRKHYRSFWTIIIEQAIFLSF